MALSKLTTDLIDVYLHMIGADHHKSSDGYFEIRLIYNGYSENDYCWEVVHKGYINNGSWLADTLEEAEKGLQKMVCEFIESSIKDYERCQREPDEWDICFPSSMPELITKFNELKKQVNA